MNDFLTQLCGAGFMPHGQCYLWSTPLIWLHAVSDSLIALAYFSIPVALVHFVRKRRDLPYPRLILMFGAFIVACGTTHLLEVWTIWHSDYYLTGAVKALTAGVSLATAVVLVRVIPDALQLTGPAELRRLNESLEERVGVRTADLESANARLQREIAEREKAEQEVNRLNGLLQRRVQELQALFEARARLAAIVTSSEDAIIGRKPDGEVTDWNAGAEKIFGYAAGEMIGHQLDAMVPAGREHEESGSLARIARGEAVAPFETQRIHRDGRLVDVSVMMSPIRDERGAVVGVAKLARDISERRQTERQRAEIDRKIRETQKFESLGILAGGIAHDFNNLLTGILGNASLAALLLPKGAEMAPCLEQIQSSSRRAAELCNQMLAYSGQGRFVLQRVDVNALVAETARLVSISIGANCAFRMLPAAGLPAVLADPSQLRQIIMNLVVNAAEALGGREGTVTITTGSAWIDHDRRRTFLHADRLETGEHVFLEVKDNGCGMDEATLARVFDPFFTTKFTGRGLGLAAVLGIVRGHKGGLTVASEPGRGATFTIFLPVADEPSARVVVPAPEPASDAGPLTVLVVDDEEVVRAVAARMLAELGHAVEQASGGREAVEKFAAAPGRYGLVLLDLTMPLLGGEETFVELRQIRPDVRVVLMSGFSEGEAVGRFAGKGLAGFLHKPFPVETLAAAVRAYSSR